MIDFDGRLLARCMKRFGEPVVYRAGGDGDPIEGRGIFERERQFVNLTQHGEYSGSAPTLGLRLADWPTGTEFLQGDTFTLQGRVWEIVDTIRETQDGHRVVRLFDKGPPP